VECRSEEIYVIAYQSAEEKKDAEQTRNRGMRRRKKKERAIM